MLFSEKIRNNKGFWIILILAVIFFIVYSGFVWHAQIPQVKAASGQWIFSWPDEMANHFFIQQFIQSGQFKYHEPLDAMLQGIVHPRSTNVAGINIVPVGFLGMLMIYGWIGKLTGASLLMYLTPVLAAAGGLLFYLILKRLFNKTVGLIAALLLFTLAPYWYYANLSLLATILFVFLLLLAGYFLVRLGPEEKSRYKVWFAGLSGLFFGLALITRSLEFVWVGLLVLIPFIFYARRVKWYWVIFFLIGLLVPLVWLLYYNQQTFGELWSVGYLRLNQPVGFFERLPLEFTVGRHFSPVNFLKFVFVPFGFHPKVLALNFYNYIVVFLWPYLAACLVGVGVWLLRAKGGNGAKRHWVLLIGSFLVAIWLIFYYGNWLFSDPLVLKNNVIASSYVRYWLPLNILFLPWIGYLLWRVFQWAKWKPLGIILSVLIGLGLAGFSLRAVYFAPQDGLVAQKKVIETYYDQARSVDASIESGAILITDRADKLFFPKHQVVMFNLDYSIFPLLKKILPERPVYYYTYLPDKDMDYINQSKIKSLALEFVPFKTIDSAFRLFKLQGR